MAEKYNLYKTAQHNNAINNGKIQNLSHDIKVSFRATKLSNCSLSCGYTALQHQAPKTQLVKQTYGHPQN